jgi:hypothetical protein
MFFGHLKLSMAMHSGEKAPSEQFDQSLVCLTTPDEYSGAYAIGTGILDRYSMSHVFGPETQGTRHAARAQAFQPD